MAARKKSETRQRNKQSKIRWLDNEFNTAAAKAKASGLSFSAYVRAAATGSAGPRAQRALPVDAELLREVLAQHGRIGNNLNQIAYQLNARADSAGAVQYEEALNEWAVLRRYMLQALGHDPDEFKRPA
jgi:hypothetical protein